MDTETDLPRQELERRLAQRRDQIDAVRRISAALSGVIEVDDLAREALDVSLECVEAEAGSVYVYDPDIDKLVFRYVVGEKADVLTGMEIEPDQGLAGKVFQSGEIDVSEDVMASNEHDEEIDCRINYETENMVTVPLLNVQGESVGVMQVLNKTEGTFDESDVAILDILASQIAAALEEARLIEEARLAEIVRFIGNLSHDVKNMMTPVQTAAETLEYIAEDTWADVEEACAENPDLAADIQAATADLQEVLPEMTEMMKGACDGVQMRMAEVSAAVKGVVTEPSFHREELNEVVDQVVPMLEVMADKEEVQIIDDVPEDLAPAVMDSKQMYNALYNLINNALQACDPGATITVHGRAAPDGQFPEGNFLEVAVEDTGSGMPQEVQEKLFTDDVISTRPQGTGLGTRIVKNVVDVHGGRVWAESEQGVGTTITFRIPLEGSPQAREMMAQAEQAEEDDESQE